MLQHSFNITTVKKNSIIWFICCISTHAEPDPAATTLPLKLERCFRCSPSSCTATGESMPMHVLCSLPPLPTRARPDQQQKSAAGAIRTGWRATQKIQELTFALKYLQAPMLLNNTRKRQSQVKFLPFYNTTYQQNRFYLLSWYKPPS